MTHVDTLLSFILTSSLLTCTAAEASILCSWNKVGSDEVHSSFLRSVPGRASPSLRLYHSVWSAERALLGCSWSEDEAVIHNYFSLCEERSDEFSDHLDDRLNFDSLFKAEELCVSLDSPLTRAHMARIVTPAASASSFHESDHVRSEVKTHRRVKRGFIVPGTLWCGSGNKAPSYTDLGVFSETDSCCREHDQCKHTILSFHKEFGVFNSNIFTISHCDCDNKFRSCLMEARDSISDVVGYTFFNLLKMHCFEFSHQLQCTQRNWFGMCKETKLALYADVHPPTLYESTSPTESANSTTINTTVSTPNQDNSTSHLFSTKAAASTVPTPLTISPSAFVTPSAHVSTETNTSERPTGSTANDPDRSVPPKSHNQSLSEQDAALTEKQKSCSVYKDLDECSYKIRPLQKKYGIRNPEPKTMYHCNCTTRLFQTLAKQTQLTKVQTVLLGHVSRSCFLPQDCTAGKTCTAALVRAELPQVEQRNGADVEEQRHLQVVRLKVRTPNLRRAKRRDRAVRLHRLCLRMLLPKRNESITHLKGTHHLTVGRETLI